MALQTWRKYRIASIHLQNSFKQGWHATNNASIVCGCGGGGGSSGGGVNGGGCAGGGDDGGGGSGGVASGVVDV